MKGFTAPANQLAPFLFQPYGCIVTVIYTERRGAVQMTRWVPILVISLALSGTVALAAEKVKTSQPGVMLSVEKKSRSRTQYYIVNTPVGVEEPYFEAEIDSSGFVYTAEYEPRTHDEVLPDLSLIHI